ncbi:Putative acetyltransferase protein [alpha proteobacterium BAL199]|nr:Putative acetyltransferase protein [alpha proteobacterium BAL199]
MGNDTHHTVAIFSDHDIADHLGELGALLHACVHHGASIGYVLTFSVEDGKTFWRDKVLPAVRNGSRLLLVVRRDGRIAGSVQLDYDTPPNQPHRAEVRKLLVHPDFRRQGLSRLLMAELERHAGGLNRRLLTLDTRTGDAAEPLYASLGYRTVGIIPGYCRDPFADQLDPTTIMYKAL